jgi:hypothetical protein
MVYEEKNPSKQRRRALTLHLPTTPHIPPSRGTKLTLSKIPLCFYKGSYLQVSKSVLLLKEGGKKPFRE